MTEPRFLPAASRKRGTSSVSSASGLIVFLLLPTATCATSSRASATKSPEPASTATAEPASAKPSASSEPTTNPRTAPEPATTAASARSITDASNDGADHVEHDHNEEEDQS